jgi:hypothetical protein
VKAKLVDLIVVNGNDAIVGAYEIARPASHACMGRVGALVDAVINAEKVSRLFLQT